MSLLLVAGMFAATSGEAFGYRRPCSHHEAAALLASGSADGASSHHGHAGVAMDAERDADADASGHEGPCSCLGNCTISAAPTAPSLTLVEGVLPAPAPRVVVRPAAVRPVVPIRISHLIPFSQAPPLG